MHFGATLRLLRLDAGFTLRELATKIGVSNAYLSRVENGHDSPPSLDRLIALARVLGLPPATLVELADRLLPFATDYLDRTPAAKELMLEILRRNPSPMDIARVRAFVDRTLPDPKPIGDPWPAKLFSVERVLSGLTCDELDDAIDVASIRLAHELGGLNAAELAARIRSRERVCSSAVGAGVAIPHALVAGSLPRALILTLKTPVEGATPDGVALRVLIVHVHPGGSSHTTLLSKIARLADQETVARICAAPKPAAVLETIYAAARGVR
jgi:PTS system nitrogen regulatory IIA component